MKRIKIFALVAVTALLSLTLLASCSGSAGATNDGAANGSADNIDTSKTYTVTFMNDGETVSTEELQGGSSVKRPDSPKKTGHTFGGWYFNGEKWNFATGKVATDMTLEAMWIADEFSVVFDYGNGVRESQIVKYGEGVVFPDEPTKENYKFDGWYNNTQRWSEDKEIKANMTLEAKWTIANVTVKFDSNGGSSVADAVIEHGTAVSKPTDPTKTDYTFLGWYCDGVLWSFETVLTEDKTLTARWQRDYLTVTFNTDGGTAVESQIVKYLSEATAPEEPTKEHYTFGGWMLGSDIWDFSNPITDSITLVAKWEKIYYTVTFDSNGGGAILPTTVHSGTTIVMPTNTSKTDHYLVGWLHGNSEFDFSTPITEDMTLTANWISVLEKQWLDYQQTMDADTYTALRKLYDYYDGDAIIDWMAGLWDTEVGAFYYSNSARDSYGYLPDLESTHQLLGWLTGNGAFANNTALNKAFPNEIKLAIINFTKNTQSASDGYFYHPQWPQGTANLQTDRYGRDLSWAQALISRFTVDTNGDGIEEKQYPNYCTPGGTKCKTHESGGSCSFATAASCISIASSANLTSPLSTASNVSLAVCSVSSSTVTPVASAASTPDYSSSEAFTAWLETYNSNIKNDSGNAHNINALQHEIIAKGYCDELLDYLDRIQNEIYVEQISAGETPTGMWQKPVNYRAVWGLLKYAPFYNNATYGREIKYAKLMVATAIKVIESEPIRDGSIHMNDIYNQWSSVNSLITNVKKYGTAEELEEIYDMLRENAPSLIDNSLLKITPYKNANGAFGYTDQGKSLSYIYGVPISLGVVESDVNATILCCSMYRCIMTCLNYTPVPLCTPSDGTRFISKLTHSEEVKKYHTFTLGIESTVTFEDKTGGGYMSVVADPTDSTNSVLEFYSVKTSLSNSDRVKFTTVQNSGDCYVFDTDMYLKSSSSDGYIFQIKMSNNYMITLYKSGSTVTVRETYSTSSSASADLATAATDTWFNLRVEYYTAAATGEAPKIKIFLDGEYVTTTSGYYGSATGGSYPTGYTFVSFYSMRSYNTDLLLDNCYYAIEDKEYVDEDLLREGTATIQKVYGGKDAMVVIVHDDGTASTVNYMSEQFAAHDLYGTIGLIGKRIAAEDADGNWSLVQSNVDYWQSILDTGRFDIANHSLTHTFWGLSDEEESGYYLDGSGNVHAYSFEAGRITEEVVRARELMLEAFPNEDIMAFIKPGFGRVTDENGTTGMTQISEKAYEIIASCHIGMRDTDGGVNSLPLTNILKVNSYIIRESQTAEDWKNVVNQAITNNGMLVFLFHTIQDSPTSGSLTGRTAETDIFFEWLGEQKSEGTVWNAFLDDAMRYAEEYKYATLDTVENSDSIALSLTDDLDDSIYNHPLTVKVKVNTSASTVSAQRPDGTVEKLSVMTESGVSYVLIDIVPDSGDVVISL